MHVFCFFSPHEISYFTSRILCNLGQWAMHPGMLKKKQKKTSKIKPWLCLYILVIFWRVSIMNDLFTFIELTLNVFKLLFDIKKQTRCHLLVNVRRFIETVQYCPLLGSFPCLWQLKIAYINFCCDISQNIFTLQKKHLFPIFVFVFNWMFVWFLYFLFT